MNNALNLQEINQEQALNLCRFFIKAGHTSFFFGRRGVGKSAIAIQSILDCNYKISYINLSAIERPDLAGYPDLNAQGDTVSFKSPYFLPKLEPNKKPDRVLLFDEVDKSPPELTAPLLEILQYKTINGEPINAVASILTGNLQSENAFSNQISSALLDRGAKYILQFDFDKWLEWAQSNGVHELILGFLVSNPDLACGDTETTCYATPSPRSWTQASDALIKAKKAKLVDIESIMSLISGYVGYEAGIKFKHWYQYYRKFEPIILSMIETGSLAIDYDKLNTTEKTVFCITACHLAKQRFIQESKLSPKYRSIEYLCQFLSKVDPEVQALSLTNSFPIEFVADKRYQLYKCAVFFDLSKALNISSE